MIKWTEEMIGELRQTNTSTVKAFAEKWGMSVRTAKTKLASLNEEVTVIEEEKEEVKLEDKLQEVNASTLQIIPSIILDMDKLISNGVKFYLVECMKQISIFDKTISDYEHTLENQYESMVADELAVFSQNIGITRRKRRLYKNEYEFLDTHRVECESFIKFVKVLKEHSVKLDNRIYHPRVLKEELGRQVITNPNNAELEDMRNQIDTLTANHNLMVERNLSLEKFRVKQDRQNKRAKGEVPAIDVLDQNWLNLFNQMDTVTRKGILYDCYKFHHEKGLTDKSIVDYLVFQETLPIKLVELGYFLKK